MTNRRDFLNLIVSVYNQNVGLTVPFEDRPGRNGEHVLLSLQDDDRLCCHSRAQCKIRVRDINLCEHSSGGGGQLPSKANDLS